MKTGEAKKSKVVKQERQERVKVVRGITKSDDKLLQYGQRTCAALLCDRGQY